MKLWKSLLWCLIAKISVPVLYCTVAALLQSSTSLRENLRCHYCTWHCGVYCNIIFVICFVLLTAYCNKSVISISASNSLHIKKKSIHFLKLVVINRHFNDMKYHSLFTGTWIWNIFFCWAVWCKCRSSIEQQCQICICNSSWKWCTSWFSIFCCGISFCCGS